MSSLTLWISQLSDKAFRIYGSEFQYLQVVAMVVNYSSSPSFCPFPSLMTHVAESCHKLFGR